MKRHQYFRILMPLHAEPYQNKTMNSETTSTLKSLFSGKALHLILELFLVLTSGFLYSLSFPHPGVPVAAFIFGLPLLGYFLLRPIEWKTPAWMLWLGGFVAWVILIFWLRHVTWTGMLFLSGVLALFWGGWFYAAQWVIRKYRNKPAIVRIFANLGLAGFWVLLEWVRSWIFTGFPWLPLSVSLWEYSALLQVAAYTGAWGLSFLLVFVNLGFSCYIQHLFLPKKGLAWYQRFNPDFYASMGMILLAFCFVFEPGYFKKRDRRVHMFTAAAIQPNTGAVMKWDDQFSWDIKKDLEQYSTLAAKFKPDLILWPEAATPWPIIGLPEAGDWIEGLSRELKTPLLIGSIKVDGSVYDADAPWYNIITTVDPEKGIGEVYAKRHLVPFGEYIPFKWVPFIENIKKVIPIGEYYPGEREEPINLNLGYKDFKVGGLICYEDIFPQLARKNALLGADFMFVVSNGAWYGDEGMNWQHMAHSVLRAVENRRPVVRCSNNGWSGWIDEYGNVVYGLYDATGDIHYGGLDTFDVFRDSAWKDKISYYTANGDWFVLFSVGCMVFGLFLMHYIQDREPILVESGREKARHLLAQKKLSRKE